MAIQLPKIQRNDVYDTSSPLPEAQAIGAEAGFNLAEGQIKMVDAVDKSLQARQKADEKIQLEAEKAVADARKTRAKSLANEYNMKYDESIAKFGALPLGGNLTPQYEQIKKDREKYKEEARAQAYDGDTLRLLNDELISQDAVLNKTVEVKNAQARVAFETQTTKQSNLIEKRNFITQAALFNPQDITSYEDMDKALFKIEENSLQYADSMGFLKDYTGKPIEPPKELKEDIRNQQSDSVKLSVATLIGENDTVRAEAIFNRYGEFLTDQDKVTIGGQLKKASNEKRNYSFANDIVTKSPQEQEKALDTIGRKYGPEAKERTGNIVSSLKADENRIKKELNQLRLQEGIKLIEANQKSPTNRWYTVTEMRNDPKMSAIYDKADYATKKKLDQLIDKPKFSDPKAFKTAIELYDKPQGLKGLNSVQLQNLTAPLDQKTTNLINDAWKEQNGLTSPKPVNSDSKTYLRNIIKSQLDGAGLLAPSKSWTSYFGGGGKKVTVADKNKIFLDKYEEQFLRDVDKVTGDFPAQSPQALTLAKELAARYIKNEEANKKSFFSFFGSDQPTQPATPPQQKVTPKPTLPTMTSQTTTTSATVQSVNGGTTSLQDMTPEQRAAYRRQILKGQN